MENNECLEKKGFLSDEEIKQTLSNIIQDTVDEYGVVYVDELDRDIYDDMVKRIDSLPYTQSSIDTLVSLKISTREELEEFNRKAYADRRWERKYIK